MERSHKGRSTSQKPFIPTGLKNPPLSLSPTQRTEIRKNFHPDGIFFNIPYADDYKPLELALQSTALVYGLIPRLAKERTRLEVRIEKILVLILSGGYGVTDLSYADRLNRPFELGLLIAYGKPTFVIARERTKTVKYISDLNFTDIHYHKGHPEQLIKEFCSWIESSCGKPRRRLNDIVKAYHRCCAVREKVGPADFDRLNSAELLELFRDIFDAKLLGVAESSNP